MKMEAEIKILTRLRRMFVRSLKKNEARMFEYARTNDFANAALRQTEINAISWCIHDLDYLVEQVKEK